MGANFWFQVSEDRGPKTDDREQNAAAFALGSGIADWSDFGRVTRNSQPATVGRANVPA
jgi:hypothetical protein